MLLILKYIFTHDPTLSPFPCHHDTGSGQCQDSSQFQASSSWQTNPLDAAILSFIRRYVGIRKQHTQGRLTRVLDQVSPMPGYAI